MCLTCWDDAEGNPDKCDRNRDWMIHCHFFLSRSLNFESQTNGVFPLLRFWLLPPFEHIHTKWPMTPTIRLQLLGSDHTMSISTNLSAPLLTDDGVEKRAGPSPWWTDSRLGSHFPNIYIFLPITTQQEIHWSCPARRNGQLSVLCVCVCVSLWYSSSPLSPASHISR